MILICLFAKSHKYIFLSLSAVDYYYLYLKVNKIIPCTRNTNDVVLFEAVQVLAENNIAPKWISR